MCCMYFSNENHSKFIFMLVRQPEVTLPLEFDRISACRDFGCSIQLYGITEGETEDIDTANWLLHVLRETDGQFFVENELFDTGD